MGRARQRPGGQGMPTHDGGAVDSAIKQGALAAIGYPGQASARSSSMCAAWRYCASYMMGGQALVTSGTPRSMAGGMACPINGLVFSHAQSPADRLVINLANGYSAASKWPTCAVNSSMGQMPLWTVTTAWISQSMRRHLRAQTHLRVWH